MHILCWSQTTLTCSSQNHTDMVIRMHDRRFAFCSPKFFQAMYISSCIDLVLFNDGKKKANNGLFSSRLDFIQFMTIVCTLHRHFCTRLQDTNALVFRCVCAALGVSAARKMAVNSLTVPRKPGEAVGAIMKLMKKSKTASASSSSSSSSSASSTTSTSTKSTSSKEEKKDTRESLTINVEYNQVGFVAPCLLAAFFTIRCVIVGIVGQEGTT